MNEPETQEMLVIKEPRWNYNKHDQLESVMIVFGVTEQHRKTIEEKGKVVLKFHSDYTLTLSNPNLKRK